MKKNGSAWGAIITSVCAIAALAVLVQTLQPTPLSWRYERELVLQGQVWRLITGTWVHLSWVHLLMNLVGLALVLVLFKKHVRPLAVLTLTVTIGAVSHGLLLGYSQLNWGAGLSGALHGLFLYYTLSYAWPRAQRFALILLSGLSLKLCLEGVMDNSASVWLGGHQVAIVLHWAGTAAGLVTAAALALAKGRVTTRKNQASQKE